MKRLSFNCRFFGFFCMVFVSAHAMDNRDLNFFSIEEIKSHLRTQKNDRILRAAFLEKMALEKSARPEIYLEIKSPLKSYDKVYADVIRMTWFNFVLKLNQLWLMELTKLHELIVETAVRAAIKKKKPEQDVLAMWREEYIIFIFDPIAGIQGSTAADFSLTAYDADSYSYTHKACPQWLRKCLKKETQKHDVKYGEINKKLTEIGINIRAFDGEYYRRNTLSALSKYGYTKPLEFVALIIANNYADKADHATLAVPVAELFIEALHSYCCFDIAKNTNPSEIYILQSFAQKVLENMDGLAVQSANEFSWSICKKPKVKLGFNFIELEKRIMQAARDFDFIIY